MRLKLKTLLYVTCISIKLGGGELSEIEGRLGSAWRDKVVGSHRLGSPTEFRVHQESSQEADRGWRTARGVRTNAGFREWEPRECRHCPSPTHSVVRVGELQSGEGLCQTAGRTDSVPWVKSGEAGDRLWDLKMTLPWPWDKKQQGKLERALMWVWEDRISSKVSAPK